MLHSHNRYKAFTIPELLVAMLVSSIVLIAVLYGFQLVSGLLVASQRKSVSTTNAAILYQALSNDFLKADSIVQHTDSIVFYQDSLRVQYYIDSSILVRRHLPRIDTLSTNAAILSLGHHELVDHFITSICLQIVINGKQVKYQFNKEYSPLSLFEEHSLTIERKWESKYQK